MTLRKTVSLLLLLGTVAGTGCTYVDRGNRHRAYDDWRRWERRQDRREWRDYRQQRRWWWRDRDRDRYRDRRWDRDDD